MAVIDNLEIRIKANAEEASNALGRLASALSNLRNVAKGGIRGLATTATHLDKLADSIRNFPDVSKLESLAEVLDHLKSIGNVKVKLDVSGAKQAESAAETVKDLPSKTLFYWGDMPEGQEGYGDAWAEPSDLEYIDAEYEEIAEDAESAANNTSDISKALIGLRDRIRDCTKDSKGLFATFARIAKMMLIRAIIRGFIKSIKEGIANLKAWSATTNHVFADSMNVASASLTNFKNSLAVTIAPLINWFIPYLRLATIRVMEFANSIANMFAMLTGAHSYDAVIEGEESVEAIGDAAGRAKEKLKDLLGFDEINRLSAPTSGGGGGKTDAQDWSGAFEEREVDLAAAAETLSTIYGILAAISALVIWKNLPKIAEWISVIKPVLKAIAKAIGPVKAVWAVAILIVSAIESLVTHWNAWVEAVENSIKRLGLDTRIKKIYDEVVLLMTAIWNVVSPIIQAIADFIGTVIIGYALANIIATINMVVGILETAWDGFKHIVGGTLTFISEVWEGIKLFFQGDIVGGIKKIFNALCDWFVETWVVGFGEVLLSPFVGLVEWVRGLVTSVEEIFHSLIKDINRWVNEYVIKPLNKFIDAVNKLFGFNWSHISYLIDRETPGTGGGSGNGNTHYQEYASGGWPSTGEIFISREAGPELVGTIGGRTAVATNNDIVAAVSQGVASAVASVMGSGGNGQSIAVNVDGRNLFNIMVNQNNAYVRQTGYSPLLV